MKSSVSEWKEFKEKNQGKFDNKKAWSLFFGIVAIIKREEIKSKHRYR